MTNLPIEKPETLGVDPEKLDALITRARADVESGVLPACQLAVARDGKLAAFETIGAATPATRFALFSSTKAVVASAVWLLIADGSLEIEQRVADYIPEFGTNGKDVITVEQVMLHTSGFPHAPLGPPQWATREGRLEAFGKWRLNWEPGSRFEYHPTSAHWVLAELIERLSGEDYRDFVEERVMRPLGLPRMLGLRPDDLGDIADLQLCGAPPDPDELEVLLGIRELPVTEVTDDALMGFNTTEFRTVGVPGGGGATTAAVMALFYQGLLHNPGGIWDAEVLADVTGRVRNSFPDPIHGVPANRALGVVVGGDDGKASIRGLPRTGSPRVFGHGGAAGQIAWADPGTGLSFSYVTNGNDRDLIRQWKRTAALNNRAAVCSTA